ncbi:MAG: AI-2E family transporter [Kiritimatiellia bacterium]
MDSDPKTSIKIPPERQTALVAVLLGIIAVVLLGAALSAMKVVVIPLAFAWMVAQLLTPMVNFFGKRRVRASLATFFSLIILLCAFVIVAMFVWASIQSFVGVLPDYKVQATEIVKDGMEWVRTRFERFSNKAFEEELQKQISSRLGALVTFVQNAGANMMRLLFNLILVFIMAAFLLFARPYAGTKVRKAFPPNMADTVSDIMSSISRQLSRYLGMQFLISLATGVLVWLSCKIIGVDAAVTWGALAFFLNFIPIIGSILAGIPPVLLALLKNYPAVGPAVAMLICVVAINQVLGNVIAPKVLGDKLNLSPVTILLSLIFWYVLWGIPGAFLSVVITASIKIVCENIGPLKPISVLMASGRSLERKGRG